MKMKRLVSIAKKRVNICKGIEGRPTAHTVSLSARTGYQDMQVRMCLPTVRAPSPTRVDIRRQPNAPERWPALCSPRWPGHAEHGLPSEGFLRRDHCHLPPAYRKVPGKVHPAPTRAQERGSGGSSLASKRLSLSVSLLLRSRRSLSSDASAILPHHVLPEARH